MRRKTLDEIGYICVECARAMGGRWPKGHCATSHTGTCDACGRERGVANVGDWNWPDRVLRGMRD